jgi:hypothetical protein
MNYVDYDDLNNAKKKILFLLKTKYTDPNTEYVETDDTNTDAIFTSVVNGFIKTNDIMTQLISLVAIESTKGNKNPSLYHRSANTYINYTQLSSKLESNFKTINKALQTIIKNIGYVEPENMRTYNEAYEIFEARYDELHGYEIIKKVPNTTYEDINNLGLIYESIYTEFKQIEDYDDQIKSTYNYKNTNKERKRNPQTLASSGDIDIPLPSNDDDK